MTDRDRRPEAKRKQGGDGTERREGEEKRGEEWGRLVTHRPQAFSKLGRGTGTEVESPRAARS